MRPQGRLAAAIEVLDDIISRHRPAALALADWGKAHRFAGSGDRAAIGTLVHDALRHRASLRWAMQADSPRAIGLAGAVLTWSQTPEALAALAAGEHGPGALTTEEIAGLDRIGSGEAPAAVQAELPDWLWPEFQTVFGATALAEGQALAARAPVDLRVNTLKADRDRVVAALSPFAVQPTPWAPDGLRIAAPAGDGRTPNLQAEPSFLKGWFELQDEASQLAALIAAKVAGAESQVLDLCAGGGGKSLALAAALGNRGQIFAYDADKQRLAPIHERLKRAGTRNVQVLTPRPEALLPLAGKLDTVVIDAPCSGSGAWRRRPETKWKLTAEAVMRRVAEQQALLDQAVGLIKTGGRIVYITCSLLPAENAEQMAGFLTRHPGWQAWPGTRLADLLPVPPASTDVAHGLLFSPARTGTDGFFVAVLEAGLG